MQILKNIQVSRLYGVNPTTVANWIESSKQCKNQLQLSEKDSREFIQDTPSNHLILSQLSDKGKIYKSNDARKTVQPHPDFYNIFSPEQISGIVLGLDTYSEIPSKYTYINGGAEIWRAYAERSVDDNVRNTVTNAIDLNKLCTSYLLARSNQNIKFNIIDIGPGDGQPMKEMLSRLLQENLINKYIGVDISPEMLKIAEKNLKDWFGSDFPFEGHVKDISETVIRDIPFYSTHSNNENIEIINIVFFLGSSLENQMDAHRALLNLRDSIRINDYLVLGQSLDSKEAKTYFDFSSRLSPYGQKIDQAHKWIPDLLGIEEILYHSEHYFDQRVNARKADIILDIDLTINIDYLNIKKQLTFFKGQRITVWRHAHHSLVDIVKTLHDLNLFVEFSMVSSDKAQIHTISSPTIQS